MRFREKADIRIRLLPVGGLVMICGCATVEPKPDFDRVSRYVEDASGIGVPVPVEASGAAARDLDIEALLADGLTAHECVEVCVRKNPRLQAALWRVGVSRADVVQASLLSNPGLSLSARFPDGGGLANLEASLAQNIADLWLIPPRKRAATNELEREILAAAREVSATAAEAKAAYYLAIAADEALVLAQENRDLTGQLVEAARGRRDAGVGSEMDVNLARAEAMRAEISAREAEREAFEARRRLSVLLGLTSDPRTLVLSERLPNLPTPDFAAEALVELAEAQRLDLRAAEAVVLAAEARWVQEKRSVFGQVEVGVSMERADRPPGSDGDLLFNTLHESAHAGELVGPELYPPKGGGQDVIIGPTLSLQLPIFDQNQARIARAAYEFRQAQLLREALRLDILQETRSACVAARTAWSATAFYHDELLPLAETNLDLSREAYRSGKVSLLAVLEAQRVLIVARSEYLTALKASALAVSELEKAVGLPIRRILAPLQDGATGDSDGAESR